MKRTRSLFTTIAGALVTLASLCSLPCAAQETSAAQPDATVSGTGRAGYIPIWRNSSTLGDSTIYQSGGNVGLGTKTPQATLEVDGTAQVDGNFLLSGNIVSSITGYPLLLVNTSGTYNFAAGPNSMPSGTTGYGNTALGVFSLSANGNGAYNTASGFEALYANVNGYGNTADGYQALSTNTAGGANTAQGWQALRLNTATGNTAAGAYALEVNTTGTLNTGNGYAVLISNTEGMQNTATGANTMATNTTGSYNTAIGVTALYANNGSLNTALGYSALSGNSTGSNNTAIGSNAGYLIAASNNIDINNYGAAADNGVIRIGTAGTQTSTYIAGIYGATTSTTNAVPVMIDSNGNLGTMSSSRRYKEDIHDMGAASSGLLRLRPVTFRYKKPFEDGSKPVQFGLIAEEVAEVYPDLVARSADGQVETVKYQVLDAMLLNELQKQNGTIAAQKDQIRSLEERLERVEAALERRTATSSH